MAGSADGGGPVTGADPDADPGSELVDVVDEHDAVVATVPRARVRRENLRHRAVFVAVVSTDHRLLIHRRSDDKDVWPGRWDLGVGGVVGAGEAYDDAARRETAEEIGVTDAAPVPTGEGRYEDDEVRLFARTYCVVHDGPFTFADGEVVEACFVTRAELHERLARDAFVPDSVAIVLPLFGAPGFPF